MSDTDTAVRTSSPLDAARPRRRWLAWTAAVALALGLCVWFLPAMLSAGWMKSTVLAWMNRSPDHRIDFADLDLSWSHGLKLKDTTVLDVRSGETSPFFKAGAVSVDVQWRPLLEKRIVADEFTISDAVLDLSHASAGAPPTRTEQPSLPEGTFGLASARVPVHVKHCVIKLAKGDVRIDDATMLTRIEGGVLILDPIDADVNGGKITGSARIGLEGMAPSHSLDLHAKGIEIDEYMAPVVAHVMPLLAGEPADGKTQGRADLDLRLTASGRRVEEVKTSLRGDGNAGVNDLVVEARTWLTQLLTAVGQDSERMEFDPMKLPFVIADNRVSMTDTDVMTKQLLCRLGGSVTLDGAVDYRLRVKPAGRIDVFDQYAKWLDPDGYIPFHLTGLVTSPDVALPGAEDLISRAVKESGLAEKAAGALGDLLNKKGRSEKPPATEPPVEAPPPEKPKRKPAR